jgi:hypothetical protein
MTVQLIPLPPGYWSLRIVERERPEPESGFYDPDDEQWYRVPVPFLEIDEDGARRFLALGESGQLAPTDNVAHLDQIEDCECRVRFIRREATWCLHCGGWLGRAERSE